MERDSSGELERQASVNDLLDEPIGAEPLQMALPILVQIRPANSAASPDITRGC